MEIFAKLESWDYLAAAMLLFSAWLLLGGIGRLQKSDPERVDAKKLRIRACGGLVRALCIWPAAICSCNIAGS